MRKFSLSRLFGRSPARSESAPDANAAREPKPPADGIHVSPQGVLHLQGDLATLALHGGARHQVMMRNAGAGVTVSVASIPHPGGEELRFAKEFALVQAGAAQALFASTVAAWYRMLWLAPQTAGPAPGLGYVATPNAFAPGGAHAGDHRAGRMHGALMILIGGLIAMIFMIGFGMLFAPGAGVPGSSPMALSGAAGASLSQAAPMPSSPPVAGGAVEQAPEAAVTQAQSLLQQARLAPAEFARLNGSSHRIQVREGSATLMAFSDPNCPACQELEREAATFKPGQGFAVIPVAFQPGSRVLVAKVLCSKDQARAWADALRGVTPNEQPCEAGLRKVDENNNLFASIGASVTPTLVSANGQLSHGSATGLVLQLFASKYAK